MRRFAENGGGQRLGRAARAYIRANGGSRRAARAAVAGRKATVRLGGFLADVARSGLREAAERIGIANVLGQDAETVFAAIVDAIAPAGATPEEAAARGGISDALWRLYDEMSLRDDVYNINALDAPAVAKAVEAAIVAVIFNRWLQEVGIRLEEHGPSPAEAVRRERDLKDYVRQSVHLDLEGTDILAMDWRSPTARQFIENKYTEAYAVFEGP